MHLFALGFVDSDQIDEIHFVITDVVEDILVEDDFCVESILIIPAEISDGLGSVLYPTGL